MTFNPECLGRSYSAPPEILDRERHLAYAAAVTGQDPPPEVVRPLACFAAVYLLWPIVPQLFADQLVGLDLPPLLPVDQEFCFERPMHYGEELTPEGSVTRADERRGMVFLELLCHGRDGRGEAVAHSRSLFLVRGSE
ncbi:MAG: FAS1-like dehydratase domain-containing protein [Candidatus Dormibacteria bacterium]